LYTNVSEKFKKEINKTSRTFKARIKINNKWYTNIKSIALTQGSCDEDNITIGSAVSSYIEVTMKDIAELFENTEVELQQGLMFSDGSIEYITMGYYTAQRPQEDNGYIKFTAYDRMQRFEKVYTSKLTFPATAQQVLDELCKNCDIETDVKQLETVYIQEKPQGYTCREVVGYIASLYGKFATVERTGKLAFKFYEVCNYDVPMSRTFSLTKNQADYKVEYLYCNIDNSTQLTQGSGSRGITFNNPYVTKERLAKLYTNLNGFTYRPATIKFLGDIRLDVWDIVKTMDLAGNTYNIPVMKMTQTFDGGVCTTIEATGKTEEEVNTDFKGPVTKGLERTYTELLLANTIIATKVDADWVRANTITTGKLEAVNAEIEYLKANKVDADWVRANTITTGKLEAVTGRIEILEANALTANSAEIKSLKAGVADINTLMFGTASGGSLTTEFSNSVVGLIGDAQIKSAMIKYISADKILSGKLYTNLVKIVSQSGNLDIADNTIQIRDSNKTARVQIGKDATGDYNIYIWDKNGKLMFDPLYGVQESGIKRAIIRNDMISDTANISGKKIDIASLITSINADGSSTLNASKIYVDTDKQTLDVSFKNLTTSVSTVSANVTTALNTANMAKSAVNNMQIGGRNLLPNSTMLTGTGWGGSTSIVTGETDPLGSNKAVKIKGTSTIDSYRLIANVFKENGYYTISFWGKASKAFNLKIHEGGNIAFGTAALTTTWKYYTYTLNVKDANTNNRFYFGGGCSWKDIDVFVYIAFPKLEKGNRATDWSPAPEDVESKIATVESKLTTQGTQLTAIQGNISSKIWQQDITTAVTSLEIGGRNLVRNSNFAEGNSAASSFWSNWGSPAIREFVTLNNKKWCHIKGTGTALYQGISQNTGIPVEKNTQYTISIRVKGAKDNTVFTIGVHWNTTTAIVAQSWPSQVVGITEKIVTVTLRTPNADVNRFNLMLGVSSTTSAYEVYFTDIKMEKGNKASDWSPAPEDTDKAIATLEGSTQTLSTQYAKINQTIGDISATVAKNTENISAKADGSTVTSLQSKVTNLQLSLDGYKTTVSNTYATKTDFNNLQIGGRNLLLNTNKGVDGWRWTANGGVQSLTEYNSGTYSVKCVQAVIKTPSTGYCILLFGNINRNKLQANKTYTLSFDIYSNTTGKTDICYAQDTREQNCGWFGTCNYKAQTWVHFVGTVTFNSTNPNQNQYLYFTDINIAGSWIIANMKLEEGNKATTWTPAQEEIDNSITTLNTQYTSLNQTVNDISAKVNSNITAINKKADGSTVTTLQNNITSLSATVNSLSATVSSNTTAINKKADGSTVTTLQSKVTSLQTDLNGYKTTVNNTYVTKNTLGNYATTAAMNTAINQKADSITQTVSAAYTTKADFNNLQIGGRNYLPMDMSFWEKGTISAGTRTDSTTRLRTKNARAIQGGEKYILSKFGTGKIILHFYDANYKYISSPDWYKTFPKTFTTPTTARYFNAVVALDNDATITDTTNIKFKLEKGTKATDWTPSSEDMATKAMMELKIDKTDNGKIVSMINASADEINLKSNRLSWTSTGTSMTKEGNLTCTTGRIGGFNITATGINAVSGTVGMNSTGGWALHAGALIQGTDRYAFCVGHEGNVYSNGSAYFNGSANFNGVTNANGEFYVTTSRYGQCAVALTAPGQSIKLAYDAAHKNLIFFMNGTQIANVYGA
jgi:predicted  nucleic acid-binding Zn-ribbon protein